MKKNIKLVSFDLDNTLWDVTKTIIRAEQSLRSWMQKNTSEALVIYASEQVESIRKSVLTNYAEKRHDLSFMRIQVLYECMRSAGMSEANALQMSEDAFEVFFTGRNQVAFFDDAVQVLETLSKSYRVFALTNGNANIDRVGIGRFFEAAISSADVGASKPDPQMFTALLERSGVAADRVVHIGDHLTDDIFGAQQVGINSIWFNHRGEHENDSPVTPTAQVHTLEQLPQAIANL